MIALLALLVGCEPESFDDCGDAACRASMALRDWDTDPARAAAEVAAVPDEVERTFLVEKLVEAHPNDSRDLCPRLPAGPARARCDKMNRRPHLAGHHDTRDEVQPTATRSAPGPGGVTLPFATLPLAAEPAPPDACAGEAAVGTCIDRAAATLATGGHPGAVAETCARHDLATMRDECVFAAAEALVDVRGADGYRDAAALCGQAGPFVRQCHTHVLLQGVGVYPVADAMTRDDAERAARFATAVRAAWADVAPAVGEAQAGWFWGRWLDGAYAASATVPGTPLAWLPKEARRAAWDAAVARLAALGRLDGSLDQRVALATEALAAQPAPAGSGTFHPEPGKGGALWPEDTSPEEAATPAAGYLGRDRRPVDPDPAVDLALSVVAAAAHASPPDEALLAEARTSGTPIVAAYAARVTPKKKGPPKAP